MAAAEAVLIVTVIVSPLEIGGQSASHSEHTREYPQCCMDDCKEQASRILRQHGKNHTTIAVCVPKDIHEPK